MSEPRKHHFLPQAYLKSFSCEQNRKAQLYVFDIVQSKKYLNPIRDVATERDFNRIEKEINDPNKLEKSLSKVESAIAPNLRNVIQKKSISDYDDLAALLNLMAVIAARNPRNRDVMNSFVVKLAQVTSKTMIADKERWIDITSRIRSGDEKNMQPMEYEEMKRFIESGQYEIQVEKNYILGMEAKLIDPIINTLAARNWCLLHANEKDGGFVTTDHPVCLVDISGRPPGIYGVGFGMPKTAVIFPLSRRLAMLGTFETLPKNMHMDYFGAAEINTFIMSSCKRQIYSGSDLFSFRAENQFFVGDEMFKLPSGISGYNKETE